MNIQWNSNAMLKMRLDRCDVEILYTALYLVVMLVMYFT